MQGEVGVLCVRVARIAGSYSCNEYLIALFELVLVPVERASLERRSRYAKRSSSPQWLCCCSGVFRSATAKLTRLIASRKGFINLGKCLSASRE